MEILHGIDELRRLPVPAHLAIGVFDGVHLGHQAVIRCAIESARTGNGGDAAVVVTFDRHPARVLRPDNAPRLLTATKHKIELLDRILGIEHLLVIPFDDAFAQWSGERFVSALVEACSPLAQICVGAEWNFGHRRSGNLDLLKELGKKHGFEVHGVASVAVDGERVSSSAIRHAVEAGEFERAARFLGREYTVLGTVIEGEKLGRKLGFPTANLTVHSEQLPPSGAYAVGVHWGERTFSGVGNLGTRPTVAGGEIKRMLEVHLFECDEDLYGEDIEVSFTKYLRPERKFDNVQALARQIERDVAAAEGEGGEG